MRQKNFTQLLLLLFFLVLGTQGTWAETTYKLTQVTSVSAGNKYVLVEGTHALTTVNSNAVQSTTSFSSTGLSGTESYIWTLESATGGFYMKMSDGKYLNNTGSENTSVTADASGNSIWSFAFTDNVALISNTSNDNRFIGNNGENQYKAYAVSNLDYSAHDFTVYLLEEEAVDPSITYTITCHVGDNDHVVSRFGGAALSLDEPAAIGGMDFAGWSSSNDVTSPVWVSNTSTVSADMELYAFFTLEESTEAYCLVEAALEDWRGDYLIAYSPTVFADGRVSGTSGIGKEKGSVNPGDKLSGKIVDVTWGDVYNVSLVAVNDNNLSSGYLLKTKDGKYTYCTSSSSSMTNTSNKNTANGHPYTITFNSSSDIVFTIHSYYLKYNTYEGYECFRFYSLSSYSNIYLYKRQGLPAKYSLGKSKSVTISAAKYATYCSDEGLNFSETGAKVYTAKVTDGAVKLSEIEGGIVPANTGFMIYKDVTATEVLSVPVQKTDATVSNNELVGLTEKTAVPWTADGKYNYILQKKAGEDKAKFYMATGAELIANRAYLSTTFNVATESHGLDIIIDGEEEGDVTSLADVKSKKDDVRSDYYDLQGRKVIQPNVKGIYVVNGKKFVVK